MRRYLYAIAAVAVLSVGVLANVGNAAPAKSHPKKPVTVIGSGASLKFSLTGPQVVDLPKTQEFRGHRIVATAKLPKGTYEVTAQFSGEEAICWIDVKTENFSPGEHQFGIVESTTLGSGGETAPVKLKAKSRIGEYCADVTTTTDGEIFTAGITAIRVPKSLPGVVTTNLSPEVANKIAH